MRWLNMHELTNLFVRYASKAQHVATVDDEKRLVLEKKYVIKLDDRELQRTDSFY